MHIKIQKLLENSDIEYKVHRHKDFSKEIRSPQDFANALGYELNRITKSLLVCSQSRNHFAIIVAPMAGKVNFNTVSEVLKSDRIELASKEDLKEKTGYPQNGVSPLGLNGISVFIDTSLFEYDTILIGAGKAGVELELSPILIKKLSNANMLHLLF